MHTLHPSRCDSVSHMCTQGVPLISLNFLGEDREVAEVGLRFMTITEVSGV
jgi:hypothetical protein